MNEKPKRRWFRFRLSTVLILTAILAWGFATRPYAITTVQIIDIASGSPWPAVAYTRAVHAQWYEHKQKPGENPSFSRVVVWLDKWNPLLKWPALALAAFLAWKAAWAIGPRLVRRRQSAAPE